MNADFLAVLEFWEREKGISRDVLVQAVEEALVSAAKKAVGPARELRCAIDTKNGDIKAFAKLVVSEKVISKHDQISVFDARRIKPDAQLGDELAEANQQLQALKTAKQQALAADAQVAEKMRHGLARDQAINVIKRQLEFDRLYQPQSRNPVAS